MNLFDVARMSVEGLGERKFRFSLNLVGILIGCAAVTGLISMTAGMRNNIYDDLAVFGATTIQVYPTRNTGSSSEIFTVLDWRDLNIISKIPGVEEAAPLYGNRAVKYTVRGQTYINSMVGITEAYFRIHSAETEMAEGRTLTRTDTVACMLGADIAQPDKAKDPILAVELNLVVVGIAKKQGQGFASNIDTMIIVPLRTYQQFFDISGWYDAIEVKVESTGKVAEVAQEIQDKLENVGVFTAEMAMVQVNQVLGTINAVLGGIAGISLLVAGVGIINTMTVSVLERTREIGTMKAIGAKSSDVLALFLAEATVTGVIGGAMGAVAGFGLSHLIAGYVGISSAPSADLGLLIVGFAVATCILSGLYPAWRASKLNPVEALRHE
jgi:putative ABC transport system permease protein